MKIRTFCTLFVLLWMVLACCPGVFQQQKWEELAAVAVLARHYCGLWGWQAILGALLLWHLLGRRSD